MIGPAFANLSSGDALEQVMAAMSAEGRWRGTADELRVVAGERLMTAERLLNHAASLRQQAVFTFQGETAPRVNQSRVVRAIACEVRAAAHLGAISRPERNAALALLAAGWAGSDASELLATTRAVLLP